MSGPWWGRESRTRIAQLNEVGEPQLIDSEREAIVTSVLRRAPAFAPKWSNRRAADPGVVLTKLFGTLAAPIHERMNRFSEKALTEHLRIVGIQALPATAARAMLVFTASDAAPEAVLAAQGFQVGAQAADGSGQLVTFETETSIYVYPGKLSKIYSQPGGLPREVAISEADGAYFYPFGPNPSPGAALLLGFTGAALPGPTISLGIQVYASPGAPHPFGGGGFIPLPVPPLPTLRWELLDGSAFTELELLSDGTAGLARSGIVELKMPARWRTGTPAGIDDTTLRWLRLRLIAGRFSEAPRLVIIWPNAVHTTAARTIRDEVLEALPGVPEDGAKLRVSQTPVVAGSLEIEVDSDSIDTDAEASTWTAVDDLALYGPEDRVYTLDPVTGILSFGNGLNGAALPPGFRNVRATRYQVGGGATGAVDAGAIKRMLSSAPFVKGASNPLKASGGVDAEALAATLLRGPQEIRARGRAVTTADFALLAQRAPGAQIVRAHAVSGLHPAYPGEAIPGVVGVFVVPPDPGDGTPPIPSPQELRSVVRYLTEAAGPAGVEVVAAAAQFQTVRAEAALVIAPDVDMAATIFAASTSLTGYLHPITGGDDGLGWPFGGRIRYSRLLRVLLEVEGVLAVERLNLIVDSVRVLSCQDYATAKQALLWPDRHRIVPAAEVSR